MQEDAKIKQKRVKNMFEKQMRCQHRFSVYFAPKINQNLLILESEIMKKQHLTSTWKLRGTELELRVLWEGPKRLQELPKGAKME